MTSKKYSSKIEFNKNNRSLDIKITYERVYSKEEEEQLKDYYQWRFSQKAGRKVPKEEIEVKPKAGDIIEEITSFRVLLHEELYLGLKRVKMNAPYIFPLLIEDLRKYSENNRQHKELTDYAIERLAEYD